MAKKRNKDQKRSARGIVRFPPSPMQPINLPYSATKNLIRVLGGLIGGIVLVVLLVFYVPWGTMYAQIKQIKLPKITLLQKAQPVPEVLSAESSVVEPPAPPQIPEPDPNRLFGRYPVRKYTNLTHTIAEGDTIFKLIRQYRRKIFPRKYLDFKQLARYNDIRPPEYMLAPGTEFLIPTAEHIASPKIGYETELKQLQTELVSQPNNPEILNQLALIYFKRSELYKARTELHKAIRWSTDNGTLHNNLGFIYLMLEDDKSAEDHLDRAIALSERSAIPLCNRGLLYMTQEKIDIAITDFESTLEQDSAGLDLHLLDAKYNLARAHEKIGKPELATQYLNELAQILPDDVEVRESLENLYISE
jgi:tetratricopeptide (TPR) repeat protein